MIGCKLTRSFKHNTSKYAPIYRYIQHQVKSLSRTRSGRSINHSSRPFSVNAQSAHVIEQSQQTDSSAASITAAHVNDVVPTKPRLVVLGSGWGAVGLLKHLKKDAYDVTVVSPRNYFLFTPLLPSATTGQIEGTSLMEPIRRICRRTNGKYFEGEAVDVDVNARLVVCRSVSGQDFTVPYDQLVVSVGATNNTFNTPGVQEHALMLKEISHAREIRHKLLSLLEAASLPYVTVEQRKKMLSIVAVGGGPTNVEFVAEFHDFLVDDISKLFPDLAPHISVTLIQADDHILNTYDASISHYAEKHLRSNDIRIITGAFVQRVDADQVTYKDKTTKQIFSVPFGICVWSTGIACLPFTHRLQSILSDQQRTDGNSLLTDNRLRILGKDAENCIYALGDAASVAFPTRILSRDEEALRSTFSKADLDRDGKLNYKEFLNMLKAAGDEYPVLSSWLTSDRAKDLFSKHDQDRNGAIDLEEFRAVVLDIESKGRSYPAVAQVASQQGQYLAHRLNTLARVGYQPQTTHHQLTDQSKFSSLPIVDQPLHVSYAPPTLDFKLDKPFRYHHFGNLAYVGGEKAAFDLGQGRSISGWGAFWLWKSVYLSKAVSLRTRWLLASDWARTWFFGRDVSKR